MAKVIQDKAILISFLNENVILVMSPHYWWKTTSPLYSNVSNITYVWLGIGGQLGPKRQI